MNLRTGPLVTALAALLLLVPAARADHDVVIYSADGASVTHDCAARPRVKIKASRGTYTFRGACAGVSVASNGVTVTAVSIANLAVAGAGNRVTAEELGNVAVQGSGNRVTYRRARGGSPPAVVTAGDDNQVSKAP